MGDDAAVFLQRCAVYGEAVVLAGDFHAAGVEVFDGLIAAAMAEFKFVGCGANRAAEELVAEANAENGDLAERTLDGGDGVVEDGGVAGAIADEEAVGAMLEYFGGCRIWRKDRDAHAALREMAEDVVLRAAVEGDDVQAIALLDLALGPVALILIPFIGGLGLDGFDPI